MKTKKILSILFYVFSSVSFSANAVAAEHEFTLMVQKDVSDPLAGVNCYVFSEGGSYLSISGTTDENGQVSFDLSEGTYKIRVDYLGYQLRSMKCPRSFQVNSPLPTRM
ncbi:MAG: carboxypeptidase regulatory-like domain-containing protein [Deltaproteobacteria bacterium]|nr:carboxypeptidase regulatory-like domain-containing protein [Deltaproteobacteria bacterium]